MSKLKYANGNMILSEEQKQEMIKDAAEHYGRYMDALKIDWRNDPNSSDTPMRVAKAFVREQVEKGKELPFDLFGVYIANKAKLTTKE